MIYIGLGYLDSRVVSTKLVIEIAILSLYCVTSKHPVTGFIIVTDFGLIFYLCTFLCMTQGPIISTHSLFHGIYSALIACILPYFRFDRFFKLASVTISYFLPDGIYYSRPVQMLANNCFCSIPPWIKEILMVSM